jgi:hypothetical protein
VLPIGLVRRLLLHVLLAASSACGRAGYDPVAADGDAGASGDGGGPFRQDASVFTAGDAGEDTFLSSVDRGFNFGGLAALRTAREPPSTILLRFDIGEVPAGATVRAATLRVWTTAGEQDAAAVRVYRVFEDWSEGNQSGAPGAASWDVRAPGLAWTGPGCGVGSRDAAARAELSVEAPAARYEAALPAAVVQAWLDDPAANRGLALVATAGAGIELESSESADPERRPALAVDWTP